MKFLFTILMVFCSLSLFAHKVIVFAWCEGDTVYTESKYPRGKMVKNGSIKVYLSDGKLILKGITDEDGAFSFKIPDEALKQKSDLKIELYAGEGHKAFWNLKYSEFGILQKDPVSTPKREVENISQLEITPASMAAKVVMGIAGIAVIFAILYYLKSKFKRI